MAASLSAPTLTGVPVVPGIGHGPAIRPAPRPELPSGGSAIPEADRPAESSRFRAAAAEVAKRLTRRAAQASGVAAEVLQATASLAQDRGLLGMAESEIDGGTPAAEAAVGAAKTIAEMFRQAGGLMAERVTDVEDIRDRLVAVLTDSPEPGIPSPSTPSVLIADDLAPADTAGLDPALITALATRLGGPTSHTAIIARQLGIPCVVAVPGLEYVRTGTDLLVDGTTGEVVLDPPAEDAASRVEAAARTKAVAAGWSGPGATSDGHAVDVLANVQDGAGARAAANSPAGGVGLLRTELCFLDRDSEPTVEEQTAVYAEVLDAFKGKKVVIRTLDAGSDKPLRFATLPDEENPALGVRGLRIGMRDPDFLDRQLDAIAEAGRRSGNRPWVMAPMVATEQEAAFFAQRCRARGLKPGVMVEVPAAALLANRILTHVEFLSIGTNDLAQYTMAADRLSGELASLTDPWQPALLSLISLTCAAGQRADAPVGVCGEAAADPLLACVLVGLGVTSLSAAAPAVAAVGAQLARADLDVCQRAARAALEAVDPAAGRASAREILGT